MKKIYLLMVVFISFVSFSFADTQLNKAISWMNNNGLTKFTNATDFMATNSLRRDEATKFFVQYATEILWLTPDTSKTSCNFSDLSKARPDLKDLIKESCQLGLFQWTNGRFMPTQSLTNAQAITVLIRMIDGKKDETQGHFAQGYFEKAQELGIMNWLTLNSTTSFDKLTNRWEVGILLYNAYSLTNTGTTPTTNTTTNSQEKSIDLSSLDLLRNQKWEIEVSVPKKEYNDYGLVFDIQRDGEKFDVITKEKNEITWRLSAHYESYSAWFAYKQTSFFAWDYNTPYLQIKYCYYLYPNIQVDFRCEMYYINWVIEGKNVSWRYYYMGDGGHDYVNELYSTYPVIIKSKAKNEVANCSYKWGLYFDYNTFSSDKIYYAEWTEQYNKLSQFMCFESEAEAKKAGYKASLLNP